MNAPTLLTSEGSLTFLEGMGVKESTTNSTRSRTGTMKSQVILPVGRGFSSANGQDYLREKQQRAQIQDILSGIALRLTHLTSSFKIFHNLLQVKRDPFKTAVKQKIQAETKVLEKVNYFSVLSPAQRTLGCSIKIPLLEVKILLI